MARVEADARAKMPGLERLWNIKKYYYVPLSYDRIFLSGSPIVTDIINSLVPDAVDRSYMIVSIDELEKVISFLPQISLSELLELKEKGADKNGRSWSTYEFDTYLRMLNEELNLITNDDNQLLLRTYNDFIKSMNLAPM